MSIDLFSFLSFSFQCFPSVSHPLKYSYVCLNLGAIIIPVNVKLCLLPSCYKAAFDFCNCFMFCIQLRFRICEYFKIFKIIVNLGKSINIKHLKERKKAALDSGLCRESLRKVSTGISHFQRTLCDFIYATPTSYYFVLWQNLCIVKYISN